MNIASASVAKEYRVFTVRPVLKYLDLWSPAAENLVIGTALCESGLRDIDQRTSADDITLGPAIGPWQMERQTHADLLLRIKRYPVLAAKFDALAPAWPDDRAQNLISPFYGAAACRLKYYLVPLPIPAAEDIAGLGAYYKRWYDTPLGKGSVEKFVAAYIPSDN